MKFIPQYLKTDFYTFCSQKSVSELKHDLNTLFKNKWYDFSVNLSGEFINENEFQITKKISFVFSKNGSMGTTNLKCKLYIENKKTLIDIAAKPSPQLYVWTIIPILFALSMLYSIIQHSTNDLTVGIIIITILLLIPFAASLYGQEAKSELKNKFVEAFNLTKL
jgi:hypothetical protein